MTERVHWLDMYTLKESVILPAELFLNDNYIQDSSIFVVTTIGDTHLRFRFGIKKVFTVLTFVGT